MIERDRIKGNLPLVNAPREVLAEFDAASPELLTALHEKFDFDPRTGCVVWYGVLRGAYAQIGGKVAHRVTYAQCVGEIPNRHDIHHECHEVGCVRPRHLTAMPHAEHLRHHYAQSRDTRRTA